jgi:hypothetical protein
MADPVTEYLRERGCPQHVVARGLAGLVEGWEKTVDSVASGYQLGLDEYLNDMDGRQLIEDVLSLCEPVFTTTYIERVHRADMRMQQLVKPAPCLWGEATAAEYGWSKEANWWYFSEPTNPGDELRADLNRQAH